MDARRIIPVPAADGGDEVIVVEVMQQGSLPLDVRLVGCEGENPYVTTIRQRNVGKLKHKFKGSDAEWEAILSHFLLQIQPEDDKATILDGLRIVSSIKGKNLEISIRKNVQGIKVTLGEIVLPRDEEFEFNPFEWSQVSARAHALTLSEVGDLKSSLKSKQVIIDKLNSQLEDFIKTTNEVETVMLQQFMELLNEKKRKIRDQSRLLAGAKVIKDTASAVQSARDDTRTRKAGPSRASKRKAYVKETIGTGTPEAALPELGSNSDQMEVDKTEAGEVKDDSDLGTTTPERTSDDETEDDGLDGPSLLVPQAREESSMMVKPSTDVAQASKEVPSQIVDIPPRRQLPFGRPSARNKPLAKKPVRAEDSETEDDDGL